MVRVVLTLGGVLLAVWLLVSYFGYTMSPLTAIMPGLNRSVARTAALMSGGSTGGGSEPGDASTASSGPSATALNSSPANSGKAAPQPGTASTAGNSDEPEIISPDSTAHLNPAHVRDVDQPGPAWTPPSGNGSQAFDPNPPAFAAPNPLPAHPHWTWDVGTHEFNNVVVTRVDADMVSIASDSGPAQVDIALLPQEVRQELHYDPVLAAQAAAARRTQPGTVTTGGP